MRSGIRISKEQREEFEKHPAQLKGQGQVQAVLEHSTPITRASQRFLYQGDGDFSRKEKKASGFKASFLFIDRYSRHYQAYEPFESFGVCYQEIIVTGLIN